MAAYSAEQLYNALKDLKVIPLVKLDEIYHESLDLNVPFEGLLLSRDIILDQNLGKTIANLLGYPFIELRNEEIHEDILHIIPEIVARKNYVVAFKKDKQGLKIAMYDPSNQDIPQFISKKTGEKVIVYYASKNDINEAFSHYRQNLQDAFETLNKNMQAMQPSDSVDSVSVSDMVNLLIEYAYDNKASDIHIKPVSEFLLVRFRIDGILHDVLKMPKGLHDNVVSRIKILSNLRTDEHMSAQDGHMKMKLPEEDLDLRISVVPIVEGEKIVMRLLSSKTRQLSLQTLGLSNSDMDIVVDGYSISHGMILATGPTGSGKTTTMYSILKLLNTRAKNIATIEDPVEYDIEGINQIQVNPKTNLTFGAGLRSILRQDPDIIFVGEIRDEETASIAINSAMTGHLVLSTLHTNDAATTLPRLIDMGIEPFLVSTTVRLIIAQRLVRKVCSNCKFSIETDVSEIKGLVPDHLFKKYFPPKGKIRTYAGGGCNVCTGTGFDGRAGIFEILRMTPEIAHLITTKADSGVIKEKAIEQGMITLLEDGIKKILDGTTTIEEVLRVSKE